VTRDPGRTPRRALLLLAVLALAVPPPAAAPARDRVWKIGFLEDGAGDVRLPHFRRKLRELGYVEGRHVVIEHRATHDRRERLAALAAELVGLQPDVIVTSGIPAAQALKKATTTIPIVVSAASDFLGTGLVANLARPGGNITGMTSLTAELSGKRVELLRELIPGLTRVAVLWNAANPGAVRTWEETQSAARRLSLQVQALEVRTADDLPRAFDAATKAGAPALIVVQDTLTLAQRATIARLASQHRLPAIYGTSLVVDAGGLISYATDLTELYRRAAVFVDKILKGARPGDLPIEQPTTFELVINLKTAKALGLTIPPGLLARADRLIR
jgi:putative ABC transport system substrate-binding protein